MNSGGKGLAWPRGGACVIRACTALGIAVLAAAGFPDGARADCEEAAQLLRAALASQDLEQARRHHGGVMREPSCDDGFRARVGRAVSLLHAKAAQDRIMAGESLQSQQPLLERGLAYGRPWPLLALLGDAARSGQDHGTAAAFYQEALVAIDDPARTSAAPPVAEIERIFNRAAESRMLAASYRPVPKTRSGSPGGLAAESIRGFSVERVSVPVTFRTGSAEFTEDGRRAAVDMAEYLKLQKPEQIAIAGHTDPRGSEAYNLELSRQRAQVVAGFLREQGFAGRIVVIARGESERFPVGEPDAYTREQRWQMDRRVELIR